MPVEPQPTLTQPISVPNPQPQLSNIGLAKSAPEQTPVVTQVVPEVAMSPTVSNYEWQGIPIDVCRFFDIDLKYSPSKDLEQVRSISEWARDRVGHEGTMGDILQVISRIQRQLGAPRVNERPYAKVAEFVKMQRVIDEMRKRQDSMKQGNWIT